MSEKRPKGRSDRARFDEPGRRIGQSVWSVCSPSIVMRRRTRSVTARHELVACPAVHELFERACPPKWGRISFRIAKVHCEGGAYKDRCFVHGKQNSYSYGISERKLEIAKPRAGCAIPRAKSI